MNLPDSDTTAYTGPLATPLYEPAPDPSPATTAGERPTVTYTSRKQRRALGDRRTAKQIVADIKRTGG